MDGFSVTKEPEKAKRCIGYLPELPPLYMDMTVDEYLRFAAQLKKVPKSEREAQVDRVAEMTGVDQVLGRLIRNLSKGYRQRVGLAQALLGFPKVLILDEPTVGLDPKQIMEMRQLIRTLGEEHTVILSSHILSEVQAVCQTILILSQGRLVAMDRAEALEKRFASRTQIRLEAEAEEWEIHNILEPLPHITGLDVDPAAPGRCTVLLETDGAEDLPRDLFFAFSRAQRPLTHLSASQASLEDIFLELTGADPALAAAEEDLPGPDEAALQAEEEEAQP